VAVVLFTAAGVCSGQIAGGPVVETVVEEDEALLLMDLAEVYQRHRRYEKALELYGQALEQTTRDYDKSRIHMSMGRIELRLGHTDAALEHMEEALALAPAEGPKSRVYPELLGLLMREGKWERARALARQYASEAGPESERTQAAHYLVQAYEGEGKLTDLARELEQALEENPEDVGLLSRLALTYERLPRAREKAAETYEKLCRAKPHDPMPFFRLAQIYVRMGELDRAAETYGRAIESAGGSGEFDPDYVRVRVAKMYADAGQQDEAHEWLGMIREDAQTDPGIVSLKADVYAGLGMLEEALQCYDRALEAAERPENRARFLFQSAELLKNNNDLQGAEQRLMAIIDDPDMPSSARDAAERTLSALRQEPEAPPGDQTEPQD